MFGIRPVRYTFANRAILKHLWLSIVILFWTTSSFAQASPPTNFANAGTGFPGQFIVSQISGAITFCTLSFNGNVTVGMPVAQPTGKCLHIGTAQPSATNPSLAITPCSCGLTLSTGQASTTVEVTNLYTGVVVECTVTENINNGNLAGQCVNIGTASP
jgi:hypothetical protein